MTLSPRRLLPWASGQDHGPGRMPPRAPGDGDDPAERLLGLDILIVEDEAMLALDLSLSMQDAGAEVVGPAFTLDAAMALVSAPGFGADAAILDVDLAGRDVFPVAEILAARGVPLLFHTGHGDRSHLASRFAGSVVCMKPALTDDIIARLQALVASRRA